MPGIRENRTSEDRTSHETEHVVLVHGTFASSAEDQGTAWWQIGSDAYGDLEKRLPKRVGLPTEGHVFRWSGDNNERARSKAAAQLINFVQPFEDSGQPYHLIGHSHGGSVIWAALRLAKARHKTLRSLRSWSTVGTPFLHQRSRSPWSLVNLTHMLFAALLLYPAARAFWGLARLPFDVASGRLDGGIIIRSDREAGLVTALVRAPILKLIEFLGVAMTETPDGTRLGSYTPDSGQSIGMFLLGTFEGWLIIGAIVAFGYLTLLLGSMCISPVMEAFRIGWEKRMEERAFREYGPRWLGIWTEDDEAINGLRATLELSVSFIGSIVPRERIFISDLASLPSRPVYWLFAPVYNRLIRPLLDATIRDIVVKTAQGNNRPAARVVAVSPHPVLPPPADSAPPLPAWLRARILADADQHASDLGPKLRCLLAQPSLTAGFEKLNRELAGRELVHTSYFDHSAVIDLLVMNIMWSLGPHIPRRASTSPELVDWFRGFKDLQPGPAETVMQSRKAAAQAKAGRGRTQRAA